MPTPSAPREIKDENGDLLARVWEENPGTVLRCLKAEVAGESKELLDYPEAWHKLSDRKLYALVRNAS